MKKCSKCNNKVTARGLCNKHYLQARRQGLENIQPKGQPKPECKEDGCSSEARALGLCALHYQRLRKGSKPRIPTKGHTCMFEGCTRERKAKGYCDAHYRQFRTGGALKPLRVRSKPPAQCEISDCSNAPVAKGLCNSHYHKLRRGTLHGTVRVSFTDRMEDISDLLDFGERNLERIAERAGYASVQVMLRKVTPEIKERLDCLSYSDWI